jgi:hypothetical protein
MILGYGDKRNIVDKVKAPFFALAGKNEGSLGQKAALRVFKEKYHPTLKSMEEQYKEIYSRLIGAMFLEFESLSGDVAYVKLPTGLGKIPFMDGISSNNDWHRGKAGNTVITRQEIAAALKLEETETFQRSQLLLEKGKKVEELLNEWLKPFTMPEQLQFSLPQLGYFLNQIDFRKRRNWAVEGKPPLQSQRRPRVINVPSDELRTLVSEATILAQSSLMKEIDNER